MTTQTLIDFINDQTRLGVAREAITNMLIGQGWALADVDEAYGQILKKKESLVVVQPLPVPVQKPKSKILKIAVVIIIIGCLVAGGIYAYYNYFPNL